MIRWSNLAVIASGLWLVGCDAPEHPLSLRFESSFGDERIGCNRPASGDVILTDLQFFVHDVEVADDNGQWHPATLTATSPWQLDNLTLIDLEDGSGACRNGSPDTHSAVAATSTIEAPTGVRFKVGVPFELNHINPATAEPPLTYTIMHWHWQAGYKFIRAGLSSDGGSGFVHMGSTQCQGTIGAVTGCGFPNRVLVELPNFDPAQQTVKVDMQALMGSLPQGSCMAERDDPGCTQPLESLGLTAGAAQRVFRP